MRNALILITTFGLISGPAFADDKYRSGLYTKIYENSQNIAQNASEIDDLDSRVQTNTNSIQQLSEQIQNLPTGGGGGTGSDPQVQANTTAIANLNTQIQTHANAISSLTTQVQANTSAIGANTVLIQTNTTNINSLGTRIQSNTDGLTSLSSQVTANTSAINGLSTDVTALQGSVDALSTSVAANTTELGVLSPQVNDNSAAIASNTSRIIALESGTGGGGTPQPGVDPVIDFSLYVPTVTTKQFEIFNGDTCNIMRQDITNVPTATGANVQVVETLTNGSADCTVYNYSYSQTADALSLLTFSNITQGTSAQFDQPGAVLTNTMSIGKSFGFAVFDTLTFSQALIHTSTLLGIETVGLPAATYTNCLKIHTRVTSTILPDTEQVSWHCPAVGEVKRIVMENSVNAMRIYQMSSVQ